MRILVTGGAGFFGHHLIEHVLKTTDWEITCLDSLTYASFGYDRLRDVNCFDDKRVSRHIHNVATPMGVGLRQELGQFDYIIHCAAETHVENSIKNPLPFVHTNVVGTANILEYARRQRDLKYFVYFSTDEVFGPAAMNQHEVDYRCDRIPGLRLTYDEWDRYNSTNPYSATKAAGEELALAWANTYKLPIIITHCMNLFGERQHPEKFIPLLIRRIRDGHKTLIHGTPDGKISGLRTYLHCRNAAAGLLYLIGKRPTARDKFNIVGQEEVSNLDLGYRIADMLDQPFNYEIVDFHSSRPGHDLRYGLSGVKMDLMGWRPPYDFNKSLTQTVDWFIDNPKWLEVNEQNRIKEPDLHWDKR